MAYSLIVHPDPELEKTADGAIDLIVSAQQPDGYLNTYYIITGLEQRWTNLRDNHELYCAGHMPEASLKDEGRRHVRVERQKWFGTACCPPNLARLAGSVSDYMYGRGADGTLFVHLYAASDLEMDGFKLQIETQYPWDGKVKMTVKTSRPIGKKLALRIPGWCSEYDVQYNGGTAHGVLNDGYYYIEKMWRNDDVLELDLDMPVEIVRANPKVRANVGKAVLMRGPLVYCLEEADNGKDLHRIRLIEGEQYTAEYDPDLLGRIVKITGKGCVL